MSAVPLTTASSPGGQHAPGKRTRRRGSDARHARQGSVDGEAPGDDRAPTPVGWRRRPRSWSSSRRRTLSDLGAAPSLKRRRPLPSTTGYTNRRYSSTRSCDIERLQQVAAPVDLQLAAGLILEPCDLLSHVAAQQLAHPASSRVSSVREATYLGRRVQPGRDRVRLLGDLRPEGGEDLVGLPTRAGRRRPASNQPVTSRPKSSSAKGKRPPAVLEPAVCGPPRVRRGACMTPSQRQEASSAVSRCRSCPRIQARLAHLDGPRRAARRRTVTAAGRPPRCAAREARVAERGAELGEAGPDAAPLEIGSFLLERDVQPERRKTEEQLGVVAARPQALQEAGRPCRGEAKLGRVIRDAT